MTMMSRYRSLRRAALAKRAQAEQKREVTPVTLSFSLPLFRLRLRLPMGWTIPVPAVLGAALLLLSGCAAMTQPINVTPELVDALGRDPASACMVNQGKVDSVMYGSGNATSTFCRTNVPNGSLSVDRNGTISITHGSVPGVPTAIPPGAVLMTPNSSVVLPIK